MIGEYIWEARKIKSALPAEIETAVIKRMVNHMNNARAKELTAALLNFKGNGNYHFEEAARMMISTAAKGFAAPEDSGQVAHSDLVAQGPRTDYSELIARCAEANGKAISTALAEAFKGLNVSNRPRAATQTSGPGALTVVAPGYEHRGLQEQSRSQPKGLICYNCYEGVHYKSDCLYPLFPIEERDRRQEGWLNGQQQRPSNRVTVPAAVTVHCVEEEGDYHDAEVGETEAHSDVGPVNPKTAVSTVRQGKSRQYKDMEINKASLDDPEIYEAGKRTREDANLGTDQDRPTKLNTRQKQGKQRALPT